MKFLAPVAFYRCKECGWRSGKFQIHGRQTKKWMRRIVNSLGVLLLLALLASVVALILSHQPSE